MKKFIVFACISISLIMLCGCEDRDSKPVPTIPPRAETMSSEVPEMPDKTQASDYEQPENIQENDKFKAMYTSRGKYGIKFSLNENNVVVTGNTRGLISRYVMMDFPEIEEEKHSSEIKNGAISLTHNIPVDSGRLTANLFVGDSEYGHFDSIVYDYIKIYNENGEWYFEQSPVLQENYRIFNKSKDKEENLKSTEYIQSDNSIIISLANQITNGCVKDYDKVKAVHDWVAENIYYDYEAFYSGDYKNGDAVNVLSSKRAVCEGYANLVAALLRIKLKTGK